MLPPARPLADQPDVVGAVALGCAIQEAHVSGAASARGRVVDHPDQLDFRAPDLPERPPPRSVLLADPAHFDVQYVINPHMEGNVGSVDAARARAQWDRLREVYVELGYPVHVLQAVPGLPDLVFMANQSLPVLRPDGEQMAVLSRMWSPHRVEEVAIVERFFRDRGVPTVRLAHPDTFFEGMGDVRWHPGRRLLYGGYGFRTARSAYDDLASLLDIPIVTLHLRDPDYYHLDTCLSPLTEHAALYVPDAFDAEGIRLLEALFPMLLPVPAEEAAAFACNGNCPDQRHLVLHQGNGTTEALAREAGVQPIPIDTSEFLKSGGSVFCMTMMLP